MPHPPKQIHTVLHSTVLRSTLFCVCRSTYSTSCYCICTVLSEVQSLYCTSFFLVMGFWMLDQSPGTLPNGTVRYVAVRTGSYSTYCSTVDNREYRCVPAPVPYRCIPYRTVGVLQRRSGIPRIVRRIKKPTTTAHLYQPVSYFGVPASPRPLLYWYSNKTLQRTHIRLARGYENQRDELRSNSWQQQQQWQSRQQRQSER